MSNRRKLMVIFLAIAIAATGIFVSGCGKDKKASNEPEKKTEKKVEKKVEKEVQEETEEKTPENKTPEDKATDAKKEPSKTEKCIADTEGNFPSLAGRQNLKVYVSTEDQLMWINEGEETIFRTIVSTGKKGSETPLGDFVIEPERGDFFYNAGSGEGAYYWVSFRDHGIYLFHSIPTDQQGNVIGWEAELLGQPASHGCVRMSMEAAKWFYENIPEGIPVHIS